MEKDIQSWLDGERDYTEGVRLYGKYGKNNNLKKFFSIKDNDFSRDKVAYELGKMIGVDVEAIPVINGLADKVTEVGGEPQKPLDTDKVTEGNVEPSIYPKDLQEMILERAGLVNKKGMLANSLDTFKIEDNEGRAKVMAQIKEIRERLNVINDTERYWQKNKTMPKVDEKPVKKDRFTGELPSDPIALLKEKKAITEARSKANTKLKTVGETTQKGIELANTIQKLNERYEQIEKAIS
jgi:hypothetical protein